jgi:hypothetical protein
VFGPSAVDAYTVQCTSTLAGVSTESEREVWVVTYTLDDQIVCGLYASYQDLYTKCPAQPRKRVGKRKCHPVAYSICSCTNTPYPAYFFIASTSLVKASTSALAISFVLTLRVYALGCPFRSTPENLMQAASALAVKFDLRLMF